MILIDDWHFNQQSPNKSESSIFALSETQTQAQTDQIMIE